MLAAVLSLKLPANVLVKLGKKCIQEIWQSSRTQYSKVFRNQVIIFVST